MQNRVKRPMIFFAQTEPEHVTGGVHDFDSLSAILGSEGYFSPVLIPVSNRLWPGNSQLVQHCMLDFFSVFFWFFQLLIDWFSFIFFDFAFFLFLSLIFFGFGFLCSSTFFFYTFWFSSVSFIF